MPQADASIWEAQPMETDPGHEICGKHHVSLPESPRNHSLRNRSLLQVILKRHLLLQNTCQEKPTTSTQLRPMPQTTALHHLTLSDPKPGLEGEPIGSTVPLTPPDAAMSSQGRCTPCHAYPSRPSKPPCLVTF